MTDSSRSLKTLLADWQTAVANTHHPAPPHYDGNDVTLRDMVENSRHAQPGSLFVARVRTASDGHQYIPAAIANGARVILAQRSASDLGIAVPAGVAYLTVADTAVAYAWLAAVWHGFPSRQLVVIGVTGTNGKTTVVNILHHILQTSGLSAGMLSTLRAVIGNEEEALALHVTTPEAPVVQSYLRRMADAGMTHCVLETTSHSLAQHRVTAVDFDIAVITNITHEHLDYHGSFDAYTKAKASLFERVAAHHTPKPTAVAPTLILNRDDPVSFPLLHASHANQLVYSLEQPQQDVTASDIQLDPWSTRFTLHLPQQAPLPIETRLFGLFNVYNMLAAAAAATALGVTPGCIQAALGSMAPLYGRMHIIDKGQPFLVLVDFAHTPDGLEKAIDAARRTLQAGGEKNGRIITVFGSAGLRDPEKRRLMAEISGRDADLTILTAEDPRTESLDDILDTMAAGVRAVGGVENSTFWRIPDRGQAIHFALTQAQTQDLVLVCGKGHEQSMCFGTTEYPWDDVDATEQALVAFLKNEPMPDLGLPTFK